ncbi:MurR/RpiR family transcriptional regulator [Poseidonocella sp. HB161398]|uniref:MurR/RpiR family transcriptional regulator n=1 Tax=Poseidonocella sp. HB161398 TaxID=2320855 RepID=UPI001107F0C0|nr:MurR/RpiR family transcriptional regulator [Poseidonocella sp. HB161398]
MSIRDLLLHGDAKFTPSEEKIIRVLLQDYPTAGLSTATQLARRSGVSDPTVVRLVVKLGFAGFPDFQAKLLEEVESQLHSPLLMMEAKRPEAPGDEDTVLAFMTSIVHSVERAVTASPASSYQRAARLIMDRKGQVAVLGGRFSRHVAGMLRSYLAQLRPGVEDMGALTSETYDRLVDYGKRDTLVVFDYRRYQLDVIAFAGQAARRGMRIVLFTDSWQSPIADHAEVIIHSPVEVASPYDTLAPAVAQIEALVAHIVSRPDARGRIEEIEAVRRENTVTLDTARSGARQTNNTGPRQRPGPKTTQQDDKT